VEQLLWRLKNGELPHVHSPKVVVIACGTNAQGLVRVSWPVELLLAT
jgi:hypothetical protein